MSGSDSGRSLSRAAGNKRQDLRRALTLNFLMFHEVTKPYGHEEDARVKVVFQHPKHDGGAK